METRRCPEGHVNYEINPYTFNSTTLNEDKHYCPVCGEQLIIEGENDRSKLSYVKKDSQTFTL